MPTLGLRLAWSSLTRTGALADLKKLGYMTTPVIVINGAVVLGFDSAKIDECAVDSNIPDV